MGNFQDKNTETGLFNRINELVDREGVSGKEYARRAGIPYTTFYKYMTAKAEPNANQLRKICTFSGISADWLLLGIEPSEASKSDRSKEKNPLDEQRLIIIIGKVESLLREKKLKLAPEKKGELIALLYQLFEDEEVDDGKVVRFLKLAS